MEIRLAARVGADSIAIFGEDDGIRRGDDPSSVVVGITQRADIAGIVPVGRFGGHLLEGEPDDEEPHQAD